MGDDEDEMSWEDFIWWLTIVLLLTNVIFMPAMFRLFNWVVGI